MKNKQYWGVCLDNEIVRVYDSYDRALEESVMWTMETGATHTVQPVKLKEENNESIS
ncbi:hypothetical protein [Oceanobacillus profundus]|uniref:hypothetical protein n=1 Tax=Oceanobacillus profundus TaxID=372463 RepID=UPI0026E3C0DD|nr:hypothetical protein [Oceanobacillus profundus]MDO6451734.1 hypothetical protein [Oceanobacillus profundus]